jgi:hypothetical protein
MQQTGGRTGSRLRRGTSLQDRPLLLSLRQMYVTIFYLGPSVMTANSAVVFVNETLVFLEDTFRCAPNVLLKTRWPYRAESN